MDQPEASRNLLIQIQRGDLVTLHPRRTKRNKISKPCIWNPLKVVTWNEDVSYFYSGLYTEIQSGIVIKKHMYTMWHGKLFQGVEIMTASGRALLSISDFKNIEIL